MYMRHGNYFESRFYLFIVFFIFFFFFKSKIQIKDNSEERTLSLVLLKKNENKKNIKKTYVKNRRVHIPNYCYVTHGNNFL